MEKLRPGTGLQYGELESHNYIDVIYAGLRSGVVRSSVPLPCLHDCYIGKRVDVDTPPIVA